MGLLDCFRKKKRPEDFEPGDTTVFILHYRFTFCVLFILGLVNWGKYFFGELLSCASPHHDTPPSVNQLCWLEFTSSGHDQEKDDREAKRSYRYLWIQFFFFLQALVIYVPHFLRHVFNKSDRTPRSLVKSLHDAAQLSDAGRTSKVNTAVDDFKKALNTRESLCWLLNFCEMLNFVADLGNLMWIALYLGYSVPDFQARLNAYVSGASWGNSTAYINPMYEVFPRSRLCVLGSQGPNGTSTAPDSVCFMPLNVINETIFVVLWIWYIILMVLTVLFLLNRAWQRLDSKYQFATLKTRLRRSDLCSEEKENLELLRKRCKFGDIWLLYVVGREADPYAFAEFLLGVGKKLADEQVSNDVAIPLLPGNLDQQANGGLEQSNVAQPVTI